MGWKLIKKGLFVTIEGYERERDTGECTSFLFQKCKKYDLGDCYDYWSKCWDKFRVKIFNKVEYEGDTYHSVEYVYDVSQMKYLTIIAGILWIIAINLIIYLLLNS